MRQTDELRELLDERGVPWKDYGHPHRTWWGAWYAEERSSVNALFLKVEGIVTPEEATAATLGVETCQIAVQDNLAETDGMGDVWLECNKCHWQMPLEPSTPRFNYCPNCGWKVVSE